MTLARMDPFERNFHSQALRSGTYVTGVRDGVTFMRGAKAPHFAPACGVGSRNGSHSVTDAVSRRVSGDEGDDGTE